MRLVVISVSRRQPAWVEAAFGEYAKRMPREARLELVEVKPERRGSSAGPDAIKRLLAKEADRIRAAQPTRALRVALDERGKALTTRELAARLERWTSSGRDVAIVIGSADGLDATLRRESDETISLSKLTLPHGLARVVVAEQLYRAWSLLRGHPYHRD